jgi:superfamily II DNA or RNA helicase
MNKLNYEEFISRKLVYAPPTGIAGAVLASEYFDEFQSDITAWALRRGRAAIFAATGLGKTRMQLGWASCVSEYTGRPVLILAPLAVAEQTKEEAFKVGMSATVARDVRDIKPGINITNYDRLHLFDASIFGGVVLDESSIIKHHDAQTLRLLIDAFDRTPFRLCCTATPSPNDDVELGTHAEFLGICSRSEMLSEFFCHDGGETQSWRLKGHAKAAFWRFVSSWAALVRSPADLGYDGSAYVLPGLETINHVIPADDKTVRASGRLFAAPAETLMDRRAARRSSISARVAACAALVNADNEQWVVWCDLNMESEELAASIRGAVEVTGSMTAEQKEAAMSAFAHGRARVIVSKTAICGFGMNWQHCHKMAFVGVTDSWERYHQGVRRIYRFGQDEICNIHVFSSEMEGAVIDNLKRKEESAAIMAEELSRETAAMVRAEIRGQSRQTDEYFPRVDMLIPNWCKEEFV